MNADNLCTARLRSRINGMRRQGRPRWHWIDDIKWSTETVVSFSFQITFKNLLFSTLVFAKWQPVIAKCFCFFICCLICILGHNLRLRGRPPPIIFARIDRPLNALQLCRWQFSHVWNFVADFLQAKCDFTRKETVLRFLVPLWGLRGNARCSS